MKTAQGTPGRCWNLRWIAGTGPLKATLIEENFVTRCGWQNVEEYFECAGIKTHHNHSCLIRRNLLTDMIHASGIWMDYGNINSRCSQNVIINTDSMFGGIFLEASQAPNMADNNFIWVSTSNGIYQHDCDELLIAHNFVAHAKAGIRMNVNKSRTVLGRLATAKRNRILNNVLVRSGQPLAIADPDNVCDHNLVAKSDPPFDLAAWQAKTGWDKHSVVVELEATFDVPTRQVTWRSLDALPLFPRVERVDWDLADRRLEGPHVLPGPFVKEPVAPMPLLPDLKK